MSDNERDRERCSRVYERTMRSSVFDRCRNVQATHERNGGIAAAECSCVPGARDDIGLRGSGEHLLEQQVLRHYTGDVRREFFLHVLLRDPSQRRSAEARAHTHTTAPIPVLWSWDCA